MVLGGQSIPRAPGGQSVYPAEPRKCCNPDDGYLAALNLKFADKQKEEEFAQYLERQGWNNFSFVVTTGGSTVWFFWRLFRFGAVDFVPASLTCVVLVLWASVKVLRRHVRRVTLEALAFFFTAVAMLCRNEPSQRITGYGEAFAGSIDDDVEDRVVRTSLIIILTFQCYFATVRIRAIVSWIMIPCICVMRLLVEEMPESADQARVLTYTKFSSVLASGLVGWYSQYTVERFHRVEWSRSGELQADVVLGPHVPPRAAAVVVRGLHGDHDDPRPRGTGLGDLRGGFRQQDFHAD
jgi:hypothetical protein